LSSDSNPSTLRKLSIDGDPWRLGIIERLGRIKQVCGELCAINDKATLEGKMKQFKNTGISVINTNFNCEAIMTSRDIDAGDLTAPSFIPEEILGYFTLSGLIPVVYRRRFANLYMGDNALTNKWSEEYVNGIVNDAVNDKLRGTYGGQEVRRMKDLLTNYDLSGKTVLVVGSEIPWIEALCLVAGASKVTTLDYGDIISQHPLLETLTPLQFRRKYEDGQLSFDAVIAFKTIEHSGLGRYGDALNPWGDILTSARAWCVTKDGGVMILGLPGGRQDGIIFNEHRVYGKYRWPLITANWVPDDVHQNIGEDFYTEQGKIVVRTFRKAGSDIAAY
jgi:hypothetical protein